MQKMIPANTVKALIATQFVISVATQAWMTRQHVKEAGELVAEKNEAIRILTETTNFLLDRADPQTVAELDKQLDFWRVVRGIPTDENDQQEG